MSETIEALEEHTAVRGPGRPVGARTRDPAERAMDLTGEKKIIVTDTAERVKNILAEERITYTELAHRIGASPSHISSLMSGSRNMTLGTLAKIGEAVGWRFQVVATPMENKRLKRVYSEPPPRKGKKD